MPTRPVGVCRDGKGGWYLKVTLGSDQMTGRREQITRLAFEPRPRLAWPGANWSPKSIAANSSRWRWDDSQPAA
jgi:hypothetical protein